MTMNAVVVPVIVVAGIIQGRRNIAGAGLENPRRTIVMVAIDRPRAAADVEAVGATPGATTHHSEGVTTHHAAGATTHHAQGATTHHAAGATTHYVQGVTTHRAQGATTQDTEGIQATTRQTLAGGVRASRGRQNFILHLVHGRIREIGMTLTTGQKTPMLATGWVLAVDLDMARGPRPHQ